MNLLEINVFILGLESEPGCNEIAIGVKMVKLPNKLKMKLFWPPSQCLMCSINS